MLFDFVPKALNALWRIWISRAGNGSHDCNFLLLNLASMTLFIVTSSLYHICLKRNFDSTNEDALLRNMNTNVPLSETINSL